MSEQTYVEKAFGYAKITAYLRVGTAPKVTEGEGKTTMASFSAVCVPYRGANRELTPEWYTIRAFGKSVDYVKQLQVGDKILVHGELTTSEQVAKDGTKRLGKDIMVSSGASDLTRTYSKTWDNGKDTSEGSVSGAGTAAPVSVVDDGLPANWQTVAQLKTVNEKLMLFIQAKASAATTGISIQPKVSQTIY